MVNGLGWFIVGAAATAAAAWVVALVRARFRAASVRRRHVAFAERFKQSGFAENPAWKDLDTLPMPSPPPA